MTSLSGRRLRLELAGAESPAAVAREVRKRLTAVSRSRSFVDWKKHRTLVGDLEMQRQAIVEQVAKADPVEALDLMWRFLALGNSVLACCEDSGGPAIDVFRAAVSDLDELARAAKADPYKLADQSFEALTSE